jgi:hypothetical protein
MKKFRFIKPCIVAFAGALSFSCIDNTYDLSNVSTKMELFGNSLAIPIGSTTVYLDSIIGGMDVDTATLRVEDGTYVFRYSGSMDMSGLTASLSDFDLQTISPTSGSVDLYTVPGSPSFPFNIPVMDQSYSSSISMSLPAFNTSLIAVDSIILTNTFLNISLNNQGLAGTGLSQSVSVTFTPQGTGADYYINNVKVTSWTVNMGESQAVEIRKLRLSSGSGNLSMGVSTRMNIANIGDVQATQAQTRMLYNMDVSGIDFDVVYGKVTYSKPAANLDPISFNALGTILGDNDVLSFYNPKITLSTSGNIGVPIDFTMNMGTFNSKTTETRSLSNTTFRMVPAANAQETKVNTFVIDRTNGTSDLFKINPDQITMGYSFATDPTTATNHFIAKSSQLTMNYAMEIPLQFGSDLQLNMGTTMESPVGDLSILDDQDDLALGLTLNVTNHIPLTMKLRLTALDEDSVALFTTESDEIDAAPVNATTGKSTGVTTTNTDLQLSAADIAKLKDTKKFRVGFIITASDQSTFVSVQPTDYIGIKVGVRMENGLILDPGKDTNNDNE